MKMLSNFKKYKIVWIPGYSYHFFKFGTGNILRKIKNVLILNISLIKNNKTANTFKEGEKITSFNNLLYYRPHTIGIFIWPYICSNWNVEQRVDNLVNHYQTIETLGPPYNFHCDQELILLDLDEISPKLKIILDQPRWFQREGQLVLNIHVDTFRAFSIAFNLETSSTGDLICFIGGIQGRKVKDINSLYKGISKSMYGLRTRDIIIEILQMFCRHLNVKKILAVADESRHHRHQYFNKKEFPFNYNDAWKDRGGTIAENQNFYRIPVIANRRNLNDVPSKKRALYRKRYLLLDEIEKQLQISLANVKPTKSVEST